MVEHLRRGSLIPVNVRLAVELYESGLTLRQVGAQLGRSHATVLLALRKAGVPRRPWDPRTGGAKYTPRVVILCALCKRPLLIRQFHLKYGGGTIARPRPARAHFHRHCRWLAMKLHPPFTPLGKLIFRGLYWPKSGQSQP